MPTKPSRPCPGKGPRYRNCPNLIKGNETCCPECKPFEKKAVREYDQKRDETLERRFLHSTRWRRIRDMKLSKDPLCERCLENGRDEAAVLVHHKDRDELNNESANLESLCNACHEEEHKDERWGK
jgi:5-methylcytosine-specific restriction enzyme A